MVGRASGESYSEKGLYVEKELLSLSYIVRKGLVDSLWISRKVQSLREIMVG